MGTPKTETKPFTPKVKKKLVLPILPLEQFKPVYVKVTASIYEGKTIEGTKEKQADILPCVNLATGEEVHVLVPTVVKSVLEQTYRDSDYVGKGFEIVKGEQPEGKRYFQYTVNELEL